MLRIPSITGNETEVINALNLVAQAVSASNVVIAKPPVQPAIPANIKPVSNLRACWGTPSANHPKGVCFIGHVDVVPVTPSEWTAAPFGGDIVDGILYGRGATDMKGAVAAFIIAANTVSKEFPDFPIFLALTGDEEECSPYGMPAVLAEMHANGWHPRSFLVGEPSSPKVFGHHVKVGRRGSFNLVLTIKGVSGHVAYRHLCLNPIDILPKVLSTLQGFQWGGGQPDVGMPDTHLTITQIVADGGSTAIVPAEVNVRFNFRYTPAHTPDFLAEKVETMLRMVIPEEYSYRLDYDLFWGNHQNPYVSVAGPLLASVQQAVSRSCGVPPQVDCLGGLTDGRVVSRVFPQADVVELGLPEKPQGAGGMHQADEGLAVADLDKLTEAYTHILRAYAAQG